MTAPSSTTTCAACGATASGNFCASCGASLAERACTHCRAPLSPQARFCHRCGQPAAGSAPAGAAPAGTAPAAASRTPWLVAAGVIALLLGTIIYKVWSDAPTPAGAPVMANAGNAGNAAGGPGVPGPTGPAPDISNMSPRERFDRLFNRVMEAAERGDTATVFTFTPMALGAYAQLDTIDADARYHAAVLQMQIGEFAPALALADTILAEQPGHLFGYVVRGTVARFRNDAAALDRAHREFQANDARETAAKRVEYLEHKPILDEFRSQARTTAGR